MLTLHHLEYSQSFRIIWLLEELGMPYELKVYKRNADKRAPEEYKAISPLGTSPTITDDNEFAMSESNAIIEYILDKAERDGVDTKGMRPGPASSMRNDYLFWFHASSSSFQFCMSVDSIFRVIPTRVIWPISSILRTVAAKVYANLLEPRISAILKLAQEQLNAHHYLAGDTLTAADITSIYSFDAAFSRTPALKKEYPACSAWLDRMSSRKAYQEALSKLGQETVSLQL